MTGLKWTPIPRDDGWGRWMGEIWWTNATGSVTINSAVEGSGEFEEHLGYDVTAEINGHHYETKYPTMIGPDIRRLVNGWVTKIVEQQETDQAEAIKAEAALTGRKV
jgi:hypothetical protein